MIQNISDDRVKAPIPIWQTWGTLLGLSMFMVVSRKLFSNESLRIGFLLLIMNGMAWMILARFMHLREENKFLRLTIVVLTVFTIIFLFAFIAWDAVSIFHLSKS